MYEYLLENLVNYSQVEGNKSRADKKGLVSELYRKQMNSLALKYFGVDSNGNYTDDKEKIVGYRCPYSGKVYTDCKDIELEHIIPISSNGGTVLFNCIPASKEVNGIDEKWNRHLIEWWTNSNYWDKDAPVRLERLIQYMLEAYTIAFKEPTEEELDDYDNSFDNDTHIENDDLSKDLRDKARINLNTNIHENITYYQFISDLISELSKNRDVLKYRTQLNELKERGIFDNIEELEKVIKAVQTVFKEILGDNSKKYLSYSSKVNMNKLLKSLKTKDYENEIRQRLSFIIKLVKDNGKEINDYFESIQDIEECNLLYYDNPNDEQVTIFINNIRISHDSKIKIFIEMLSNSKYTSYKDGKLDSNNIFRDNEIPFKGYEHLIGLNISQFWHNNSSEIKETIYIQKKELENKENRTIVDNERLNKLNLALKAIDDYDFANKRNQMRRIEKFIEMLSNSIYTSYKNGNPDSNNIFSQYNEIPFEGYEHIEGLKTNGFWSTNSSEIIETINVQKKELENKENRTQQDDDRLNKLNLALKAIDEYDFANKRNQMRRIEKFIEMLSNPKYTSYKNGNPDGNNIFSYDNEVSFEGYEHIEGLKINGFWEDNSSKIREIICIQKKKLESMENRTLVDDEKLNKLNLALKAIGEYDIVNHLNLKIRIEKFIEMLSNPKYTSYKDGKPDCNNIFSQYNKISFEGYEHIDGLNINSFWRDNSSEIKETIYAQKKELENKENRTQQDDDRLNKLNLALKSIDDYDFANKNNAKRRIEKFIDMLSNSIYTSYKDGKPDSNNIFSQYNEIPFEGYEHIEGLNTSRFWSRNSSKFIIPLLFYNKIYDKTNKTYINSDKDYSSSEYDSARNAVMEYLNYNRKRKKQPEFNTVDEYIDTLDKTKKEVKALIELRDTLLSEKERLLIENQELTEELNSSHRRTM